jgi:hemoglobin-like flavoprotein
MLSIKYETMTAEEIKLIKRSWRVFREISPGIVGDTFYSKLFMEHPSLRKMFPKDMHLQYQKLVDMLSFIVSRLDNMDGLTDDIVAMGKRHEGYGVKPEQYKMVGEALIWTLGKGLGNDFTLDVKNAWLKCYHHLSSIMTGAAVK